MTQTQEPHPEMRTGPAGDGREAAFGEAVERSRAAFDAGLRLWEEETARFVEDLAAQSQATFGRLCECQTPLDVLSVEQEWLRARSRFYLESGLRFADAFAAVARGTRGEAGDASRPPAGPRPTHA